MLYDSEIRAAPVAQTVKNMHSMEEDQHWKDPLEKGLMTHSSTPAWEMP